MFKKSRKNNQEVSSDALIYTDSNSREPVKKNPAGRKRGLLMAVAAAVMVILVVVTLGISVRRREDRYERANILLEQKEYAAAASELEALGDYRDSRNLLTKLEEDQAAYAAAAALVDQRRYDEAVAAFRALGDYGDSALQAAYHVNYRKACDLMTDAAAGESQLLTRLLDAEVRITDEGDYAVILGYEAAAALLESLGDYEDSAALVDQCYYSAGRLKLNRQNWDGALAYVEKMSKEAAEQFYQEYLSLQE